MRIARLKSEVDFPSWREQARSLLIEQVRPEDVTWAVGEASADLFDAEDVGTMTSASQLFKEPLRPPTAPKTFLHFAKKAALHSDPERFALLYRLLWRLQRERGVMEAAIDPDISRIRDLVKSVRRDQHKMTAFVRFREVETAGYSHFIAWFEPEHHIVEATADFFVKRFTSMRWSILTPKACAHWDLKTLSFTAGASKSEVPNEDALEEYWCSYYANIFNPARLKLDAMRAEMPKKYWRNLPEASLIKSLTVEAANRASTMIEAKATAPRANLQKLEAVTSKSNNLGDTIEALRNAAKHCRDCPLWKDATQTVFGEGPSNAAIMFVGEQPGDQEDIAGKPFVGPAGRLFDQALSDVGIERDKTYVTNAVKHFKFAPRGKRRIHQKPNASEIKACRQWFERELEAVRPTLIVALGATAAYQVFGRAMPIQRNRGEIVELEDGTHVLITVHPSFLLRVQPEDKEREYKTFLRDLKIARRYVKAQRTAA